MVIRGTNTVDGLYALFLGRLPESNVAREHNIGRDVFELAKDMIESEEFEMAVVDRACRHGILPHQSLSLEHLPNVLNVITETGLASSDQAPAPADWKSVLQRVLTAAPCRGIVEARYGELGQQLIDALAKVQPTRQQPAEQELDPSASSGRDPLIVSAVDIVANSICRGWVIDRNNPQALLHIRVKINGLTARIMPADEFRRDVQDLYGGEGRAGFSVRLDTLPEAPYLARASLEIVELSQGVVVLPERVVELSPRPAVGIEAEIREELMHLREAVDRLERSLPQLAHSQSWALPFYGSVRPCVELVVSPPAVGAPVGFSVIIMDDPMRPEAIEDTLASVLSQTYQPCEILLAVPADSPRSFTLGDRMEVVRLQRGEHPNSAANSIAARATGSHLLVLDAGTVLAAEALAWFAVAIERTGATVIYSDREIVAPDALGRERLVPLFNPALDRELLQQRNYVGETFCVMQRAYVELDGLTEAQARALRTVQAHLDRSGAAARAIAHEDAIGRAVPDAVKILWEEDRTSRISVVIPTRDRADMVFALISSLRRHTAAWDLLEIVVVVNGAPAAPSSFAFSEIENLFDRVRIVFCRTPFNWAAINNSGVNYCTDSGVLVFLNDDMICVTPHWDVRLSSQLARPEIGVVGGRLLYPNGATGDRGCRRAAALSQRRAPACRRNLRSGRVASP